MTSGIRINGVLTYRVKKPKNRTDIQYLKKPIPKTEPTLKNRKPTQNTDTDP